MHAQYFGLSYCVMSVHVPFESLDAPTLSDSCWCKYRHYYYYLLLLLHARACIRYPARGQVRKINRKSTASTPPPPRPFFAAKSFSCRCSCCVCVTFAVVGDITLGELLCDTLVEAEDAPSLRFAINANEVSNHGKRLLISSCSDVVGARKSSFRDEHELCSQQ